MKIGYKPPWVRKEEEKITLNEIGGTQGYPLEIGDNLQMLVDGLNIFLGLELSMTRDPMKTMRSPKGNRIQDIKFLRKILGLNNGEVLEDVYYLTSEYDNMFKDRYGNEKWGTFFNRYKRVLSRVKDKMQTNNDVNDYLKNYLFIQQSSEYPDAANLNRYTTEDIAQSVCIKYVDKWNYLYDSMLGDYNPIENYNMKENGQDTLNGTRTDGMELTKKDTTTYGKKIKEDLTGSETTDGLIHNNTDNTGTIKDDGTTGNTRTLDTTNTSTENSTSEDQGTVTDTIKMTDTETRNLTSHTTADNNRNETRDLTTHTIGDNSTMRTDNLKDGETSGSYTTENRTSDGTNNETTDNTLTKDLTNSQNNVSQENRTEDGTNNTTYDITDKLTKEGTDTTDDNYEKGGNTSTDSSTTSSVVTTSSIAANKVVYYEDYLDKTTEGGKDTTNKGTKVQYEGKETNTERYEQYENKMTVNTYKRLKEVNTDTQTFTNYTEGANYSDDLTVSYNNEQESTAYGKTITDSGNPHNETDTIESGSETTESNTQINRYGFNDNTVGGGSGSAGTGTGTTQGGSPYSSTHGDDTTSFKDRKTHNETNYTTDNINSTTGTDTVTKTGSHSENRTVDGELLTKNGTITHSTEKYWDTATVTGTEPYEEVETLYPNKYFDKEFTERYDQTSENTTVNYGKETTNTKEGKQKEDTDTYDTSNSKTDDNTKSKGTSNESGTSKSTLTHDTTDTGTKTGTENVSTTLDVDNKKTETNTGTETGTETNNGTRDNRTHETAVTTSSISAFRTVLHTGTQDTVENIDNTQTDTGTLKTNETINSTQEDTGTVTNEQNGTNKRSTDMVHSTNGTVTVTETGTINDEGTSTNTQTLNTNVAHTQDYNTDTSLTNTRDLAESGTDSFDSAVNTDRTITDKNTNDHTLTRTGNIGVTTTQQMITQEIELRQMYDFLEIVMEDIARELTMAVH